MSQIGYKDVSEIISKKRVYYEGSDILHAGYALCYNFDYGIASDAELGRAWRVEKPISANLKYFAGLVSDDYEGFTGPGMIDICVPTRAGQRVTGWSDQNCTLGSTVLCVKNASYCLGAQADGADVARAAQTVNRSGTNGTVLVELFGLDVTETQALSELLILKTFLASGVSALSAVSVAVDTVRSLISATSIGALAAVKSDVLVLESEMSAVQGLAATIAASNVSQASVQSAIASRVLVLESEVSAVQGLATAAALFDASALSALSVVSAGIASAKSRILVLESETSALQGDGYVSSQAFSQVGVPTTKLLVKKMTVKIDGVNYTIVKDISTVA